MQRALTLARRGWGQTAPNPMVGAVVVRDGVAVGEGFHARYGEAHAEVEALRAAGDRARGATVYVTLEPCAHFGKTPPCAPALIAAGVSRVVVAASDPSPEAGGGAELLRSAGIAVVMGVEEEGARELNAAFFHALSSPRPFVTLKLAISLDSAIADATGRSRWITGDAARLEVHRLRANSDAIAVGIGTVLADDPSLTVREGFASRIAPRRVVFDREARLPLDSMLARTSRDVPTLVLAAPGADDARARALQNEGVDVVHVGSNEEALLELRARGVRSLLVEGGARLAGSLLGSAVVDRLVIFRAPMLLGAGSLGAFAFAPSADLGDARRFAVVSRATVGPDAMITYAPRP